MNENFFSLKASIFAQRRSLPLLIYNSKVFGKFIPYPRPLPQFDLNVTGLATFTSDPIAFFLFIFALKAEATRYIYENVEEAFHTHLIA